MAVFTTSGTFMLLFLAGLQNIDDSVNEAAALDGATEWRKFRYITVPMIRPTLFTVVTLGLIGTWQVFDQIYVGTKGSPLNTTLTPAFLSFNTSFNSNNWGVGAAIAFILFAIIVFFTIGTQLLTRSPDRRASTAPLRADAGPRRSGRVARRFGHARSRAVSSSGARSDASAMRRRRLGSAMTYSFLLVLAVVYIFPFVIAIVTSFKTEPNATANPLGLVPHPSTTSAFHELYKGQDFLLWVKNSVIVTLSVTFLRVFLDSLAGYALARLRFRGRAAAFATIVAVMAVPGVVLLIPKFLIIRQLGIYDTYYGMIVPLLVDAAGVFIMKNFFESIPISVEESARIDGASLFRIYWSIVAADGASRPRDALHLVVPRIVERAGALHHLGTEHEPQHADEGRRAARLRAARLREPLPLEARSIDADDDPRRDPLLRLPAPNHERVRGRGEGIRSSPWPESPSTTSPRPTVTATAPSPTSTSTCRTASSSCLSARPAAARQPRCA